MMNRTMYYNISVAYPDNFRLMDEREMEKYFAGDIERWGVHSDDKKITLSIAKSPAHRLLQMMTDSRCVARGAERTLRKNLKDFKKGDTINMKLLGKRACGFSFEYRTKLTDELQHVDMIVVKYQRQFYVIFRMSPVENYIQNRPILDAFLTSIQAA
ncbi:MAG: hypothetical protein IJR57_09345 [Ruminococcus sp.]|nr:hypothetical protein [Ruminococcus sp.]